VPQSLATTSANGFAETTLNLSTVISLVVTSLSIFRLRIIFLLTRVNGLLHLNPFPDIRRTLNWCGER